MNPPEDSENAYMATPRDDAPMNDAGDDVPMDTPKNNSNGRNANGYNASMFPQPVQDELITRLTRFEQEFLSQKSNGTTGSPESSAENIVLNNIHTARAFLRLMFHLNAIVKGETRDSEPGEPETDWDELATECIEKFSECCYAIREVFFGKDYVRAAAGKAVALSENAMKFIQEKENGSRGGEEDHLSLSRLVNKTIPFLVRSAKIFIPKFNDFLQRNRMPVIQQQQHIHASAGKAGMITQEVFISRLECAELLATGFMNCIPKESWGSFSISGKNGVDCAADSSGWGGSWPRFDFNYVVDCEKTKTQCLLNYFTQIAELLDTSSETSSRISVSGGSSGGQENTPKLKSSFTNEYIAIFRKSNLRLSPQQITENTTEKRAAEIIFNNMKYNNMIDNQSNQENQSNEEANAQESNAQESTQESASNGNQSLCDVRIENTARIDDFPQALQADFANEYIGGGVLESGCVQEEIRFSVCPELLVSMLLCERMADYEAIEIWGAECFS